MYEFEKHLTKNELSMDVINARRFAVAVRKAMDVLQESAGFYHLTREPYYQDTQAFLEKMAARLEAEPQQ